MDAIAPTNAGSERVKMRTRKHSNCLPFLLTPIRLYKLVSRLAGAMLKSGLWNGVPPFCGTTGTAERNKANERRETAKLPVLFWIRIDILKDDVYTKKLCS